MYQLNVITDDYDFLIPFAVETGAYIKPLDTPNYDYFQLCFVDDEHYQAAKECLNLLFGLDKRGGNN